MLQWILNDALDKMPHQTFFFPAVSSRGVVMPEQLLVWMNLNLLADEPTATLDPDRGPMDFKKLFQ